MTATTRDRSAHEELDRRPRRRVPRLPDPHRRPHRAAPGRGVRRPRLGAQRGRGRPHAEDVQAGVRVADRAATGFSFVEVLTMCPTGWFIPTAEGPDYMTETLGEVHIMGELKVDGQRPHHRGAARRERPQAARSRRSPRPRRPPQVIPFVRIRCILAPSDGVVEAGSGCSIAPSFGAVCIEDEESWTFDIRRRPRRSAPSSGPGSTPTCPTSCAAAASAGRSTSSPTALEQLRAWNRTLADARYAAIAWPEEWGGRGAGVMEQVVYARGDAPRARAGHAQPARPLEHRAGDHRARHRRAEARRSSPACCAATTSGARASPSPTPAPTSRRCARRRCATATAGS